MAKRPVKDPDDKGRASGAYHDSQDFRDWVQEREIHSLEDAVKFLFDQEQRFMAIAKNVTDAQNRQAVSFAKLSSDVAALKASLDPDIEADNAAIAANLNETSDKMDALDATIKPAV